MKVLIDVVFAVVYYCCGAFFYSWPSSQLDQLDQALAEGEQPQLPGNDLADAIKVTILSIRVLFVIENMLEARTHFCLFLLSPLPPLFFFFPFFFFFAFPFIMLFLVVSFVCRGDFVFVQVCRLEIERRSASFLYGLYYIIH